MVLFDEEKERAVKTLTDMALLSRKEEHADRYNRPREAAEMQTASYRLKHRLKYEGAQLVLSAMYGPNITTLMIQEAERRASEVR